MFELSPNHDSFEIQSGFTLGSASNGINPPTQPVTLQLAAAQNASLTGTVKPVPVTLAIGADTGTTSVTATIASGLAAAH
ncbi:MAG: hypothetical protein ACREDD_07210 [Methylocella sp.]